LDAVLRCCNSLHINPGNDVAAILFEARPQFNASQAQPDHISSIEWLVERCTRTMFDMCKVVDHIHADAAGFASNPCMRLWLDG